MNSPRFSSEFILRRMASRLVGRVGRIGFDAPGEVEGLFPADASLRSPECEPRLLSLSVIRMPLSRIRNDHTQRQITHLDGNPARKSTLPGYRDRDRSLLARLHQISWGPADVTRSSGGARTETSLTEWSMGWRRRSGVSGASRPSSALAGDAKRHQPLGKLPVAEPQDNDCVGGAGKGLPRVAVIPSGQTEIRTRSGRRTRSSLVAVTVIGTASPRGMLDFWDLPFETRPGAAQRQAVSEPVPRQLRISRIRTE